MFIARQKLTATCAKSRHTPMPASSTSADVVCGRLVPYENFVLSCTQSQIAWTRPQPGSTPPNSSHARSDSASDGHSRLGSVYSSVSSGSSSTGSWRADQSVSAGVGGTSTTASYRSVVLPGANVSRRHVLPYRSR